jgi:hypothetical protein
VIKLHRRFALQIDRHEIKQPDNKLCRTIDLLGQTIIALGQHWLNIRER